jgi:hypothetical protein
VKEWKRTQVEMPPEGKLVLIRGPQSTQTRARYARQADPARPCWFPTTGVPQFRESQTEWREIEKGD